MLNHNNTSAAAINYELIRYEADDRFYGEFRVYWPDVCAALKLTSEDEYDGQRDDELREILLASGAPNWILDPTDSYPDEVAWIVWDQTPTDDDLVWWAMFNPAVAGSTDDLDELRKKLPAWDFSRKLPAWNFSRATKRFRMEMLHQKSGLAEDPSSGVIP